MRLTNAQVLAELEKVRLRQIPWHKSTEVFNALLNLGLVMPARQQVLSLGNRPAMEIAVLTDRGRAEHVRLKRCLQGDNDRLAAIYIGAGGTSPGARSCDTRA